LSGRSVSYGTGSLHPSQSFKGKYEYCGHGFIVGNKRNDWQDVDYVLRFFNRKKGIAQGRYKEYVSEGIEKGRRPDLVGGGLIRSLGGWSEARKLGKSERLKGDERILGDSQFVLEVLKESEERFERKYELKAQGYDLDALAERVEEIFGMEPGAYL
jgi:putative transposase